MGANAQERAHISHTPHEVDNKKIPLHLRARQPVELQLAVALAGAREVKTDYRKSTSVLSAEGHQEEGGGRLRLCSKTNTADSAAMFTNHRVEGENKNALACNRPRRVYDSSYELLGSTWEGCDPGFVAPDRQAGLDVLAVHEVELACRTTEKKK